MARPSFLCGSVVRSCPVEVSNCFGVRSRCDLRSLLSASVEAAHAAKPAPRLRGPLAERDVTVPEGLIGPRLRRDVGIEHAIVPQQDQARLMCFPR